MAKYPRRYRPRWDSPMPSANTDRVKTPPPRPRHSRELLDETKQVWQPYYARELTDEDAREIIENMIEFVNLMADLHPEEESGGSLGRI